jgi:hypothetical protein
MTQFRIEQIKKFLEYDRLAPAGYSIWRKMNDEPINADEVELLVKVQTVIAEVEEEAVP